MLRWPPPMTADLKANIHADFEKCYTSDVTQALQNAATWLDPRYKMAYLMEEECRIATTKIKEEMMAFEIELACGSANEDCRWHNEELVNVNENDDDQPVIKKKKKSLAKLLGQVKKTAATSPNATTPAARIDLGISRYVCTRN